MMPEAGSDGAWCVAMRFQELLELSIGQQTNLGGAIHAALDFDVNMAVVDQGMEVVVVHDIIGEHGNRDVHVGVVLGLHGGAQIKVFEVTHHASCIGHGDDTVEKDLDSGEVCCFGADIASVINAVATHGPPDAMWDVLFGAEGTNHMEVCGLGARGS